MDSDLSIAVDLAIEQAVDRACESDMVYGENDCVLWAADVLRPFLGFDPVVSYRGRYADEGAARSLMGPFGLVREVCRVARAYDWPRVTVGDAHPGDLGIVRTDFGPACALFWRMDMWVGPRSFGFATLLRRDKRVRFAWRPIPCRR